MLNVLWACVRVCVCVSVFLLVSVRVYAATRRSLISVNVFPQMSASAGGRDAARRVQQPQRRPLMVPSIGQYARRLSG